MTDAAASGAANDSAPLVPSPLVPMDAPHMSELPPSIPRDHPAWQRDVLTVSARVRAVIAQLRPITVRVLTFWDHIVRTARIREYCIEIDPSGCYRARRAAARSSAVRFRVR